MYVCFCVSVCILVCMYVCAHDFSGFTRTKANTKSKAYLVWFVLPLLITSHVQLERLSQSGRCLPQRHEDLSPISDFQASTNPQINPGAPGAGQ